MKKETQVEPTHAIAEYSVTEAELGKLKSRLAGAKYDVSTTMGMDTAKRDRREVVTLRTNLDKLRLKLGEDARDHIKKLNAEAARITTELLAIEQPIDEQIKAEEARKEAIKAEKARIERERIDAIQRNIAVIRELAVTGMRKSADDLELWLGKLRATLVTAEKFAEFIADAENAKAEVVEKLEVALIAKREEEAEAERQRAEREAEEKRLAEEREAIAAERAELEKARLAEAARQKEVEDKARAEREEADRIAAEERAKQQAIIDAEREKLRLAQEEANRKERERQEREAAAEAERQAEILRQEAIANETVTILKSEYEKLLERDEWLSALEGAGVDNWDGWDEAVALRKEWQEEAA
jgi:hypothetical protein